MSSRPTTKISPSQRVKQASAARAPSHRSWWITGGVVLVLVAALVVAVVATRPKDDSAVTIKGGGTVVPAGALAYGDVQVTGTALPELAASGGTDPAVGLVAPQLQGEQFDGSALTIPGAGRAKVVMFVAHWCPHCQKEVPEIAAYLAEQGLPADVGLYAVATSTNNTLPNFAPADWLHRESWPVPTIADNEQNAAANAYGVSGFPYFVVVGADGKVVERTSGELTMVQFQQLIDHARAGTAASGATGTTGVTSATTAR